MQKAMFIIKRIELNNKMLFFKAILSNNIADFGA